MSSGPVQRTCVWHNDSIDIRFDRQLRGAGPEMACSEQPQQRIENFGVGAMSDTELLAMILQGDGTRIPQAVMMASRLIAEAGSIAGLISWTASDYRRLKGIGRMKGLQLAALAEIARRMMTSQRDLPRCSTGRTLSPLTSPQPWRAYRSKNSGCSVSTGKIASSNRLKLPRARPRRHWLIPARYIGRRSANAAAPSYAFTITPAAFY